MKFCPGKGCQNFLSPGPRTKFFKTLKLHFQTIPHIKFFGSFFVRSTGRPPPNLSFFLFFFLSQMEREKKRRKSCERSISKTLFRQYTGKWGQNEMELTRKHHVFVLSPRLPPTDNHRTAMGPGYGIHFCVHPHAIYSGIGEH